MVLPLGLEPRFSAPEADALSIELRKQILKSILILKVYVHKSIEIKFFIMRPMHNVFILNFCAVVAPRVLLYTASRSPTNSSKSRHSAIDLFIIRILKILIFDCVFLKMAIMHRSHYAFIIKEKIDKCEIYYIITIRL